MIELTENLEALYDPSIAVTDLALHGCSLGDDATHIDRSLITATIHHVQPIAAQIWPDAYRESPESLASRITLLASPDYYYFMSKEQLKLFRDGLFQPNYEWFLSDRIKHVIEFGGKLLTGSGPYDRATGYRIKNGRIVMIDIDAEKIPFLYHRLECDCLDLFGTVM